MPPNSPPARGPGYQPDRAVLYRVLRSLLRDERPRSRPAPAFHAASKAVRRELWDAYALFVVPYRTAAEKLRAGIRDVVFPRGSFPPPMPLVG